jgi:anti-sigma B factor antagonist
MRTNYSRYRGTWVCRLEGEMTEEDVPRFHRSLAVLPAGSSVIFDLSGLSFLSSAGMGTLVTAVRRAREGGGDAVLCRPSPEVAGPLRMTLLPRFAPVAATLEDALCRLRPRAAA